MKIEYHVLITMTEQDVRQAAVNGGKAFDLASDTTRVIIRVAPEAVGEQKREAKDHA